MEDHVGKNVKAVEPETQRRERFFFFYLYIFNIYRLSGRNREIDLNVENILNMRKSLNVFLKTF